MDAVWLGSAGANLNVVRETRLFMSALQSHSELKVLAVSHPHGRIESTRDLVILLQSWATAQDLWHPELTNGTLHVPYLPLSKRRCLDPLRRFSSHSTYHVGMGEGLGSPLVWPDVERGRYGLGDAGMERGVATWDHERMLAMVAGGRSLSISISSSRTWREGVSD